MGLFHFIFLVCGICVSIDYSNAAACTQSEVVSCTGDESILDKLSSMDSKTMQSICGMATCFKGLTCDLPEKISELLSNQDIQSFCAGSSGGDGTCSVVEMMKCQEIVKGVDPEKDMKAFCGLIDPLTQCFEKLMSNCKGDMANTVSQAYQGFKGYKDLCSGNCDINKCKHHMDEMENMKDEPSEYCGGAKLLHDCLQSELPKCKGQMREMFDKALKQIAPFVAKECCNVFVVVNKKCIQGNEDLINNTFQAKDDQCQKIENLFTCTLPYKPKCPSVMMTAFNEARKSVKTNLATCEQKGYKITVNYKDSGVVTLPTVTVLLTAVFAGLVTSGL